MNRVTYMAPHRGALFVSLAVVGDQGAVEFQFTVYPFWLRQKLAGLSFSNDYGIFNLAGLEFHCRAGAGEPHHKDCRLIGDCWHDGSSLQAMEQFVPAMMSGGSDVVFTMLESRYSSYFRGEA